MIFMGGRASGLESPRGVPGGGRERENATGGDPRLQGIGAPKVTLIRGLGVSVAVPRPAPETVARRGAQSDGRRRRGGGR